jgi:hypothetical protein
MPPAFPTRRALLAAPLLSLGCAGPARKATEPPPTPLGGPWAKQTSTLVAPRYGHALVPANGALYAVGGWNSISPTYATTVEKLESGVWKTVLTIPGGRRRPMLSGASLNGEIYLFGGSGPAVGKLADRYDPFSGWSVLNDLPVDAAKPAVLQVDGKFYLFCAGPSGTQTLVFDPSGTTQGSWSTRQPYPALSGQPGPQAAAFVCGTILVTDGQRIHKYNLKTDTWTLFSTATHPQYSPGSGCGAIAGPSGFYVYDSVTNWFLLTYNSKSMYLLPQPALGGCVQVPGAVYFKGALHLAGWGCTIYLEKDHWIFPDTPPLLDCSAIIGPTQSTNSTPIG